VIKSGDTVKLRNHEGRFKVISRALGGFVFDGIDSDEFYTSKHAEVEEVLTKGKEHE